MERNEIHNVTISIMRSVLYLGDNEPIGSQVVSMMNTLQNTEVDWRYTTEPDDHACLSSPGRRCVWPRGKVVGGTSTINGMCYNRGNPADYDKWANLGNPGWSYDEVLPFFKLSENNKDIDRVGRRFHGTGGPVTIGPLPYNAPLTYSILRAGEQLGKRGKSVGQLSWFVLTMLYIDSCIRV